MEKMYSDAGPDRDEPQAETSGFIAGDHFGIVEDPDHNDHHQPAKRKTHTHHGIGKYRSYSNHSSASDQPFTTTSW